MTGKIEWFTVNLPSPCQGNQFCVFCSSFHDGFPENWAALRDSWVLLVEKRKASKIREESPLKVQHLIGDSSFQSNPQGARLLEPPQEQEYFSLSLLKEETIENVNVEVGMTLEFSGGRLVALEDQLKKTTRAEGHFELDRYPTSASLQRRIEKEENVMELDSTYGRLLEVKDEIMLDWLDLELFASEEKAEGTDAFKKNLDTEEILDSHATTLRKKDSEFKINLKVPNPIKGPVCEPVASFDIGQELVAKDTESGLHMFEVKKTEKRKISVKKSKGGSKVVPNCDECGKTFSRYSKRLLHINVVHRKVMPVKCEISCCDKGFASKRDKEEHIRVVHNHLPFTCPMVNCAKSFSSKTNCTAHVRMVHQKLRPYACPYPKCGVHVTRKFALEYHKRAVHGEPKLSCPVLECSCEFNLGWQLAVHVKNYHGAAI